MKIVVLDAVTLGNDISWEAMKAFGDEFLALDVRSKDHLDGYAWLLSERYPWLKKDSILGYINTYMLSNFMPDGPKTA